MKTRSTALPNFPQIFKTIYLLAQVSQIVDGGILHAAQIRDIRLVIQISLLEITSQHGHLLGANFVNMCLGSELSTRFGHLLGELIEFGAELVELSLRFHAEFTFF